MDERQAGGFQSNKRHSPIGAELWFVEYLPIMFRALGLIPRLYRLGMVAYTCSLYLGNRGRRMTLGLASATQ